MCPCTVCTVFFHRYSLFYINYYYVHFTYVYFSVLYSPYTYSYHIYKEWYTKIMFYMGNLRDFKSTLALNFHFIRWLYKLIPMYDQCNNYAVLVKFRCLKAQRSHSFSKWKTLRVHSCKVCQRVLRNRRNWKRCQRSKK